MTLFKPNYKIINERKEGSQHKWTVIGFETMTEAKQFANDWGNLSYGYSPRTEIHNDPIRVECSMYNSCD